MQIFQIFVCGWMLFSAFSTYAAKLEFKNPLDSPDSEIPVVSLKSGSIVDELKKHKNQPVSVNIKFGKSSYSPFHVYESVAKVLGENNLTVHSLSLEGVSEENNEGIPDLLEKCSGLQRLYFSVENEAGLAALKQILLRNIQTHTVYLNFDSFKSSKKTSAFFIALEALAQAPLVKTIYLKGTSRHFQFQATQNKDVGSYSGLGKVESLSIDFNDLTDAEKEFFEKISVAHIKNLKSFGLKTSSPDHEKWLNIYKQPLLTELFLDLPMLRGGNPFFENLVIAFPGLQNLCLNRGLKDYEMIALAKLTDLKTLSLRLNRPSRLKPESFITLFEGLRQLESLDIELQEPAYENQVIPLLARISSQQIQRVRVFQPFTNSKLPIREVSELLEKKVIKTLELGAIQASPEEWFEFYAKHPQIQVPKKRLSLEWTVIVPKNKLWGTSVFLGGHFDKVKRTTSPAEETAGLQALTIGKYLSQKDEDGLNQLRSQIEIVTKQYPEFKVYSKKSYGKSLKGPFKIQLKSDQIGIVAPTLTVKDRILNVFLAK